MKEQILSTLRRPILLIELALSVSRIAIDADLTLSYLIDNRIRASGADETGPLRDLKSKFLSRDEIEDGELDEASGVVLEAQRRGGGHARVSCLIHHRRVEQTRR